MGSIVVLILIVWFVWKVVKANEHTDAFNGNPKLRVVKIGKYQNRVIDLNKGLFERNADIIEGFAATIDKNNLYTYSPYSRSGYGHYIDDKTRDCINEICTAEDRIYSMPKQTWLSTWRVTAPLDLNELSKKIEAYFSNRQNLLKEIDRKVSSGETELNSLLETRKDPLMRREIKKRNGMGKIYIEDVKDILKPNKHIWLNKENAIVNYDGKISTIPLITSNLPHQSIEKHNADRVSYNKLLNDDVKKHQDNKMYFEKIFLGYKNNEKKEVIKRLNLIISSMRLPKSLPKFWDADFDAEKGIAIVELSLPDVVHSTIHKWVSTKSGLIEKPLLQKEIKDLVPQIHPAIILRYAYEIFRNDVQNIIKLLVVNGWVEFDDPNTGLKTKNYTASLAVQKDQIINFNLQKIDPLSAFSNLKGKSAGKLVDIIPIAPIMTLDREDKRFIATKEVIDNLNNQTNLASMDWQDFESLIAELFQKEFAADGVEVKVTQASRDRGVDAVIFDPDPIKGGKYIIQAKRYTNTVDVSAVRDLCAVVKKEGASKGILVTTSSFGADAYAFANNEPIKLLNGVELMWLLEKHGYRFRIDLAEARKLYSVNK